MKSNLLALLLLLISLSTVAQTAGTEPANDCYRLGLLLDPATPAPQREDHLARLQAAAGRGESRALHQLGALYRLGPDHPAKLLPRDHARARGLLSKAALGGELLAMAGLAEIELKESRSMDAMIWAQVMTAYAEKHAVRIGGESREYQADLILRAYDAMGRSRSRALNDEIQEYVNGFVVTYGERIDTAFLGEMSAQDRRPGTDRECGPRVDYERWPLVLQQVSQRRRLTHSRAAGKLQRAGLGYFYVDVEPDGSVSRVLLIDALPDAEYGSGLRATVERLRFNAIDGAPVRGAIVPMSMNTGAVTLKN